MKKILFTIASIFLISLLGNINVFASTEGKTIEKVNVEKKYFNDGQFSDSALIEKVKKGKFTNNKYIKTNYRSGKGASITEVKKYSLKLTKMVV